ALLALMNLLQQTTQPEVSEERPVYLGFTDEDTFIFAPAEGYRWQMNFNKEDHLDDFLKSISEVLLVGTYDEIIDLFDFYFDEEANPVVTYNVDGL
ncbi:5057_t:CDS:2, partial [Dentiscutata heterogama]